MKKIIIILVVFLFPHYLHGAIIGIDNGHDLGATPRKDTTVRFCPDFVFTSNLFSDIFLTPNVGVEFSLGRQWSISLSYTGAWWSIKRELTYWRLYGVTASARRYFEPQRPGITQLHGHHVGLCGHVFTYDFEMGKEGEMGGNPLMPIFSNPQYGIGIEYGYTYTLSERLSVDFFISLGYLGGLYHKYDPADGHFVWKSTSRRHYFGPTNMGITLFWHPWRETGYKGR